MVVLLFYDIISFIRSFRVDQGKVIFVRILLVVVSRTVRFSFQGDGDVYLEVSFGWYLIFKFCFRYFFLF